MEDDFYFIQTQNINNSYSDNRRSLFKIVTDRSCKYMGYFNYRKIDFSKYKKISITFIPQNSLSHDNFYSFFSFGLSKSSNLTYTFDYDSGSKPDTYWSSNFYSSYQSHPGLGQLQTLSIDITNIQGSGYNLYYLFHAAADIRNSNTMTYNIKSIIVE